jgi:hypothetical protein
MKTSSPPGTEINMKSETHRLILSLLVLFAIVSCYPVERHLLDPGTEKPEGLLISVLIQESGDCPETCVLDDTERGTIGVCCLE